MAGETCSLDPNCTLPETRGGGCLQHKFGDGIRVNGLALFAHDRRIGVTQAQKAREMFDASRKDNKQIARVRGKRTATEVKSDGGWERV